MTDDSGLAKARATALSIAPGVLLAGVGGGMAFPILPLVGLKAGLSLGFIGLILAANRFGRVLVNPIVGVLVDRLGAKRLLLVGLALQAVVLGLYWAGVVTGHPGAFFLFGRLLHGPSSSCVFIAGQTLALHAGGEHHKGLAAGIIRSAMSIGLPFGLVLGGLLAGWIGPANAFAVAMVAPIVATAFASSTVPDLRVKVAIAPRLRDVLKSLEHKAVVAIAAVNFVTAFSVLGVMLTTIGLLVHARSISLLRASDETSSGLFMGYLTLCMALSAPFAGRMSDHRQLRGHVVLGGAVTTIPGVVLIGTATSAGALGVGLALVGLGMGAVSSPLLAMLGDIVPREMRGSAVGCLQLFGDAGGAFGPIVGASLFGATGHLPYILATGLLVVVLPVVAWLGMADRAATPAGKRGINVAEIHREAP